MPNELEIFKKKLLYRASYRGTKEMDILLSSFVKKYINTFKKELEELEFFLKLEDEVIRNYYNFDIKEDNIEKIQFQRFLKNLKYNGGEGGIEPTNELPRCWFSRPVLSTSATSPEKFALLITINANK